MIVGLLLLAIAGAQDADIEATIPFDGDWAATVELLSEPALRPSLASG